MGLSANGGQVANIDSSLHNNEDEEVIYGPEVMIEVFKRIADDNLTLEKVYRRIKKTPETYHSSPKQSSK